MAEYENQNEYIETPETPVSEKEESAPVVNNDNRQDAPAPEDGRYNDPYYNGPYNQGPYNNGPYDDGPYNNGPYDNGPYNNGPYDDGPYNNGPYNNGPYNNGPYNNGPYNNGPYNNGPCNNPYNPYHAPTPPKQKNGFATTALICGIIGLLNLCCFSFPTAIIMGVGAISFAVISKKDEPMTRTAIAGVVLGVITIILGVVEFFYSLWLSDLLKDPQYITMFNQLMEQFEQQIAAQTAGSAK